MWDRCLQSAKEQAESEMDVESAVQALTWEEVFDKEYRIARKR